MSTAPDFVRCQALFHQLQTLSEAILETQPDNIEAISQLIEQRQSCLDALLLVDRTQLNASEKEIFQAWALRIQETDRKTEAWLNKILATQSATIQHMVKARHALSCYKYPVI